MLEEAGWKKSNSSKFRQKNGQELKITLSYNSNNPIDKTIGEYMQGELAKIGINLELQGEEEQAHLAAGLTGHYGHHLHRYGVRIFSQSSPSFNRWSENS